jgi:DNA-binding MarR family transcriptional regulator
MSKLDDIFNIAKQQPVLPIEIASKLNLDSFTAKAFLDQLVEMGKLKMTSEKIGGVPVYFVAGQELIANSKIKELLNIKPTAKVFAQNIAQTPSLEQKRAEFKAKLEEIEKRESLTKVVKPKPEIIEKTEIVPEKFEKPLPLLKVDSNQDIEKKPIEKQVVAAVKSLIVGKTSPVIESTLAQLNDIGAEILSKEIRKRGKEAIITVKIPSNIGPLQFLVIVQSKKTITKDDLSLAYATGVDKKLPVLLYSPGKLAKNAQQYLETIAGVVKFKQL